MFEESAIFGKARHFYGGIEPSTMKNFSVIYTRKDGKNVAKITATLPENTTTGEQTLCTVAGAIIRRKSGSLPKDEFDGELVQNITSSGIFYDEDVIENTSYTYAAFPYTTQSVYRRDAASAATVTILEGYLPDPMQSFTATPGFISGAPQIKLDFSFNHNILSEGSVVDTVSNVMIRRSSESYPIDETQGELVVDFTDFSSSATDPISGSYTDTNVSVNTNYYYAAFPHSTQGMYNRDAVNRVASFVDAGDPPTDMTYFTLKAISVGQNAGVTIEADIPSVTNDANAVVSVPIRRKTGGYPTSVDDGDLVVTFASTDPLNKAGHHQFNDVGLENNVTYYYRAFPTTDTGAVNTNDVAANRKEIISKARWIFGFEYNPSSDPDSAITYIEDNINFSSAYMDFATHTFNYGDWNFEPGTFFMPRPCILNQDGSVRYYLDPDNYTLKSDGTAAEPSTTIQSSGANYMMEWPGPIYVQKGHSSGSNKSSCRISNKPWSAKQRPIGCFARPTKTTNKVDDSPQTYWADKFYTAIFPGTSVNNTIRSLSGSNIYYNSTTNVNMKLYAEKNNIDTSMPEWSGEPYSDVEYEAFLLTLLGKSTDCQSKFGRGRLVVSSSSSYTSGSLNDKGMFYGSQTNESVKVFGMEDLWGTLPRYVLGYWLLKEYYNIGTPYTVINKFKAIITAEPWGDCFINYNDGVTTRTQPGFGANLPNCGNAQNSWEIYWLRETGQSPYNQDLVAPTNAECGNGYISILYWGVGVFLGVYPAKATPDSNTDRKNYLTGSSTTYTPDYCAVKTYPSAVLNNNDVGNNGLDPNVYVPCTVGTDSTCTNDANIGKAGPYCISFTSTLSGTNIRIRYVQKPSEV